MHRERRRHERRATCMPVWVCDGRTGLRHQGQVLNISAGGVYVLACQETSLSLGKTVELTIGTHNNDHGGFEMHHSDRSAKVVRTESLGYATGLALQFQRTDQRHLMPC